MLSTEDIQQIFSIVLEVITPLHNDIKDLAKRMDRLESRMDSLEKEMNNLKQEMKIVKREFSSQRKDFRNLSSFMMTNHIGLRKRVDDIEEILLTDKKN